MKYFLILVLCASLISGCKKNDSLPPAANHNQTVIAAQSHSDLSYGNDPAQKMDIFLPANRSADSTRTIVLVHGGAWTTGDKSDFNTYVAMIKQRLPHYAIVNVNYRLATQTANAFPAQENDILAAITFLHSKKAEYKISSKLALLGASAGGHLALLQAYKYPAPWKAAAVISFFGPTDMTALYNSQTSVMNQYGMQMLLGGTPSAKPDLYQSSSPLQFAGAGSCATLLLHGGTDPLVPAAQSATLQTKLQAAGVPASYVFYPSEGHGWTGSNLNHSFDAIADFLKQAM